MQSSKITASEGIVSHLYYFDAKDEDLRLLTEPFEVTHHGNFDFWNQVTAYQRRSLRDKLFVPIDDGGMAPVSSRVSLETDLYSYVVPPKGGALVIFDSVSLPHSVDLTRDGLRLAIGGWWHEETATLRHTI